MITANKNGEIVTTFNEFVLEHKITTAKDSITTLRDVKTSYREQIEKVKEQLRMLRHERIIEIDRQKRISHIKKNLTSEELKEQYNTQCKDLLKFVARNKKESGLNDTEQ